MRTLFLLLAGLLSAFFPAGAGAQDFTIEGVNASMFPTVSLRIRSVDGKPIEKGAVHLTDGGQPVTDFRFEPAKKPIEPVVDSNAVSEPRAICFLIETGAFTSKEQVAAVKSVLTRQIRTLGGGAVADICYYSGEGGLAKVSPEFTSDYATLVRELNSRVAWNGGPAPRVDFYKALYDCLDFMQNRKGLPESKQIILISTGNHNAASGVNLAACEQKNALSGIVVNAAGLRSGTPNATDNLKAVSARMGGEYRAGVSEDDIEAAVATFLGGQLTKKPGKATAAASLAGAFDIRYNSPVPDAAQGRISITIAGITRLEQYAIPGKDAAYRKAGAYSLPRTIGLIAGLLLALGLLILFLSRRRRAAATAAPEHAATFSPLGQDAAGPATPAGTQPPVPAAPVIVPVIAPETPAEALPVVETMPPVPAGAHRTVITGMKLPYLTVLLKGAQHSFPLTQHQFTIGRSTENGIVIPDPTVSAVHAMVKYEGGHWYLTDNGSTNGTFINGQRVERALLQHGAQIALGAVGCLFEMR